MAFWKNKKVLITGISGFVGPYLAEALRKKDAHLYGLSRTATSQKLDAVTCVEADLLDYSAVATVIEDVQPDVVFQLAAQSSVHKSFEDPIATTYTNVMIAANMLEALRLHQPKATLLHAGSSEVYGLVATSPKQYRLAKERYTLVLPKPIKACELPASETNPLRPISPYAISRVHNELLVQNYFQVYGMRTLVSRSFNHEGRGRGAGFVTSGIIRSVAEISATRTTEMKIGNVSAFRDWSHVRDVVNAYLLMVEKGNSGECYNVASGRTNSVLTFLLLAIEERLGKILSIQTLEGKKKISYPLAPSRKMFFGMAFEKTKVDEALLSGRIYYELADKGLVVETEKQAVKVLFDASRFRAAEVPVLLADIRKISKLGYKPEFNLRQIAKDMTIETA
jgi:GDP-mannose 4,6-dehydratase